MTDSRLASRIKRHPTAWFFVFAFSISWIGWFLAPSAGQLGPHFSALVSLVGSFGPAFSAILVSRILNPSPSEDPKSRRGIAFVVIFVVSFLVQLLATYVVGGDIGFGTIWLAVLGAIIAGYVVSCLFHPQQGVVELMAGLRRGANGSKWVWVALFLPFVWQFMGATVDLSLGGNEWFTLTPDVLVALAGYYPFIVFFGGGLNEEPGWRGFAVPRMQRRCSPLVAGLVIGIIWSIWHFPLHATAVVEGGIASFLFRFLYNVPLGVLFSWFYNRSRGNLFACVLLHASYNSASTIFGNVTAQISMVLMIVFTATAVVYDKMWRKEPAPPTANRQPDNDSPPDPAM